MPRTVKAIVVSPRTRPRGEVRASAPPTYRLRLDREDTGQVIHVWSGIPHDRIGPLLQTMATYLPWIARAAAAREALARLMDLFR